jgi:hypothetical protein
MHDNGADQLPLLSMHNHTSVTARVLHL